MGKFKIITAVLSALMLAGVCQAEDAEKLPEQADIIRNMSKGSTDEKLQAVRYIDRLDSPDYAARLLAMASGDKQPTVRAAALLRLSAYTKYPQTESVAIKAAADSDPAVRKAAVYTLGAVGSADAREAVYSAMLDKDKGVRLEAIAALGRMKDISALEKITFAMQGADFETRRAGAMAFEQMQNPKLTDTLTALAVDEQPVIGSIAMRALGKIATPEAQTALKSIAENPASNATVAAAAATALGRIGGDENMEFLTRLSLSKNSAAAAGAVRGLGSFGPKAFKPLADVLENSSDTALRILAGQTLAPIKAPAAAELFSAMARDSRADISIRLASLDWLAVSSAAGELKKCAGDSDPRIAQKAAGLLVKLQEIK